MNVLLLGDRLSYDISCYLPPMAKSAKEDINFISISGFSCLEDMYRRSVSDSPLGYTVKYNEAVLPLCSLTLRRVLASREFSYAVISQAPRNACDESAYTGYLSGMARIITEYQPNVKLILSQGYAYEDGFPILHNTLGYKSRADMSGRIMELTALLSSRENLHTVAPTALAQGRAEDKGYPMLSDKVTMTEAGKYLGSLILYQCISRKSAVANKFVPQGLSSDDIKILKDIALESAKEVGLR